MARRVLFLLRDSASCNSARVTPLTYPTSFRNAGLPGGICAGMETLISASGPAFFAPPSSCTLFAIQTFNGPLPFGLQLNGT